jgi:hypothetical protein
MSNDLENVATCHGPAGLEFGFGATSLAKVDFLAVSQDEAFARSQTPDQGDIVFFASAFSSRETFGKSLRVRKAKSKPDAPLGCSNMLSTGSS